MAAYRQGDGLKVTCGLTASTPGSAPGQRSVTSMEKLYLFTVITAAACTAAKHGLFNHIRQVVPM